MTVSVSDDRDSHSEYDCGCGQPRPNILARRINQAPQRLSLADCRRHLTYHVWPAKHHDEWQWNLEQLAQRWGMFNGRKVLGVTYCYRSLFPDDVLRFCEFLGLRWDAVIVRRNSARLGEVKTWRERLAALWPEYATDQDVVFSAHAKGVRHGPGVMRPWVSTMLEACLDEWPIVREQLEWHTMTGCFLQPRDGHRWHYSGSFYWFRWGELARRNWKHIEAHYSGTETWPWLQCHYDEVGCLYGLNCGDLYTRQQTLRDEWNIQRAFTSAGLRSAMANN